jgi:hypothetical protein
VTEEEHWFETGITNITKTDETESDKFNISKVQSMGDLEKLWEKPKR